MTDWDNTARDAISALHAQLTTNKELRRQIADRHARPQSE